jgi:hypothetical protein
MSSMTVLLYFKDKQVCYELYFQFIFLHAYYNLPIMRH